VCIDSDQTGFIGKGSDHLQLIKIWPSHAPGKGVCSGANFLAPPYYSQRSVFASPLSVFSILKYCTLTVKTEDRCFIQPLIIGGIKTVGVAPEGPKIEAESRERDGVGEGEGEGAVSPLHIPARRSG